MIGMIGMLVANKSIFMHTHKLADGTIIVHAHPFDRSNESGPYQSHQHTEAEFLIFQNIEIFFPLFFLIVDLPPLAKKAEFPLQLKSSYNPSCIILHKGRAPPEKQL